MFALTTRILIVDGMASMRKLVTKSCQEIGFTELTEAGDGKQAWELITSSEPPFGLVISEWKMPNCSGIDLLKRIRGDRRFGDTPFILVTAEADSEQIIEAAKAGVSNYLLKPFTTEGLKEKIEHLHHVHGKPAT